MLHELSSPINPRRVKADIVVDKASKFSKKAGESLVLARILPNFITNKFIDQNPEIEELIAKTLKSFLYKHDLEEAFSSYKELLNQLKASDIKYEEFIDRIPEQLKTILPAVQKEHDSLQRLYTELEKEEEFVNTEDFSVKCVFNKSQRDVQYRIDMQLDTSAAALALFLGNSRASFIPFLQDTRSSIVSSVYKMREEDYSVIIRDEKENSHAGRTRSALDFGAIELIPLSHNRTRLVGLIVIKPSRELMLQSDFNSLLRKQEVDVFTYFKKLADCSNNKQNELRQIAIESNSEFSSNLFRQALDAFRPTYEGDQDADCVAFD